MKKRILTIAAMLFLGIMIPISVNAATISVEPKEMLVNDIVTVTVAVDTANTEAVQFDLDFDNTKYKYMLDSAKSELDSTGSNLLDKDTVRVSTFNFNTTENVHTVELKFQATATGKSIPFKVTDLEATDGTGAITTERLAEPTATVAKIGPAPATEAKPPVATVPGNKLPDTGDVTRATAKKSIAGVYTKLITGSLVVPYALPTSDDVLTQNDIKAEFGDSVDVTNLSNPVKSGESFTLNGQQHIILIYGDVNKDGKVTTADALIIRKKYELPQLTPEIVADVADDTMEDSKAVQQFVLRLRQSETKTTILDEYPVEFVASDFNFSYNTPIYRGEKSLIATISLKDSRTITSDILSDIKVPNADIEVKDVNGTIEIYATPHNSNSFSIAPTLASNNLKNGKIAEQPKTIAVEEVKTVTNIKLFDEAGTQVTDSYSLISGEKPILNIKYYHTYPDGLETELTADNMNDTLILNKNQVSISAPTILGKAILLDNAGVAGNLNFINKLKLDSTLNQLGTDNLTITIKNNTNYSSTQNYKALLTIPLTVKVINEEITGIKINGNVVKPNDEIEMNIYSTAPADFHINRNNKDFYFTALQIDLLTNTGKTKKITPSMIVDWYEEDSAKDPNLLTICQISDREDSPELRVVSLIQDLDTKEYKEQDDNNKEADAIGISYLTSYDKDISALSQGLEIYYGGTHKITIKVNPVDNRTTTTSNDPTDNNSHNSDFAENLSAQVMSLPKQTEPVGENEEDDVTTSPEPSESPKATESTNPDTTPEVTITPVTTPEVTPSADPKINEIGD